MRRLFGLLLVCTLMLGLVPGHAAADDNLPPGYDQALRVLRYFNLVSGDAGGYRPLDLLTRAEVAKLATAGMAMADQQAYYQTMNTYPDVTGHWARGYIGLAKQLGIMRGYPDGTFRPDRQVSYAEAIALFAGVAGLGPSGSDWPQNWVQSAQDAGIIPPGAPYLSDVSVPARRADVFVLLYRALTQVKDFSGTTLLQRRFKQQPPIISLSSVPTDTQVTMLTVAGTVDSAERVTINGAPATLSGKDFSADVPLAIGVNTLVVSATDIAGNSNVIQQQVVRENTDPATITISGPHAFGAGAKGHLDVTVKDTNGAPISSLYNLLVDTPTSIGSFDPYSGTLFAAQAPAQGVMTFTMGAAKATWPVTIGAGGIVSLQIQPQNALVKRGQTQQFTLAGVDQYGNAVDVSSMSPVWSADNGVIDGRGVFAPTGGGTATVTATVGDQTVRTKVGVYGKPAKIAVTAPDKLTANNADTGTLQVQVQDADGNLVPDYNGSVSAVTTDPTVVSPTALNWPVQGGQATVTVQTGTNPGQASIAVTIPEFASGTAIITVNPQHFAGIALSTDPTTLSADGTTKQTLTLTAMDSSGKPMLTPLNPPLTVHLVSSAAQAIQFDTTQSGTMDVVLGAIDSATHAVTAKVLIDAGMTEGVANIAGMISNPTQYAGIPVRALQLRTAHVGNAAKLSFDRVQATTSGTTVSLYLRVLDQNGNQVTNTTTLQNLVLTLKDENGQTYPATVNLVAGGGRAEFDLLLYKAGTYTFTATAAGGSGGPVMPASQSVVVNAGAPVSLAVSAQPSLLRADGGVSHGTITATVQDQYGNVVPTGNYDVLFQRMQSGGATGKFKDTVVTTQQGVAKVLVASDVTVGTDIFTASASGLTTRNSVAVSSAIMGVPVRLALRYGDNNGDGVANSVGDNTVNVGTLTTVYVDIMDNQNPGYVVTNLNGETIMLHIKNLTTGDQQVLMGTVQYGTATFTFTESQATTYALQATLPSFTSAGTIGMGGTAPDFVVHSGTGAALVVTSDFATIRSNPGKSYATLTVSLTDAAGNPTIAIQPINVTLKASSTNYGNFTQDNTPGGKSTDTCNVNIPAGASNSPGCNWFSSNQMGPVTIAASASGYATGTTVVTTKLIGPAFAIAVQPPADTIIQPFANDDSSVSGQDVKVTAMDGQGLQVTDYGVSGEQIAINTPPGTVVVAYYDYTTGNWVSLDQIPGDGKGEYPTYKAVTAYKGQAWFRVRAASMGTYAYSINLPGVAGVATSTLNGNFKAGPVTRLNLVATPSYTINGASVSAVAGGGKTIMVTAQFVDQYGNIVTNQSGPVLFQLLDGPQYGTLLSSNANAQSGTASAVFQSATATPLMNGTFHIAAYTSVTQPGGAPLTVGSQANPVTIAIKEDSIAPTALMASITPGGTGADNTVNAGDFITVNFSEAVNPSAIFSGLVPGTPLATGLDNLRVLVNQGSTQDTITFSGLTLGTITLKGDNLTGMTGSSVAYSVSRLALSADGTQLTVVLGNPIGSVSPVGLILSSDLTQSTFAPDAKLTDLAGNAMVTTPVQLAPASGF